MRLFSEGLCSRYKLFMWQVQKSRSRFLLRSESNFEAHLACKQHIFSIALASYVIWHLIFLFMTCFFWSWLASYVAIANLVDVCLFIYLSMVENIINPMEIRLIDCLLIPGTEVMKKSLGSPSTQCIGPYWVCYSSKQV